MTIDRIDILLSRAIDGAASDADWLELEKLAANEPSLWRTLAEEMRVHNMLVDAVQEEVAVADNVEIDATHAHATAGFGRRMRAWSGWAAAAVLAIGWLGASGVIQANNNSSRAGLPGLPLTADEALDQYRERGLTEGRLMSELPAVMLETRLLDNNGTIEVVFLRRFVERAEISAVYTAPETGQGLVPVPIAPVVPVRGQEFDSRVYF